MRLLIAIETIGTGTPDEPGHSASRLQQFQRNTMASALQLIADRTMNCGGGDREAEFEHQGVNVNYRFETSAAAADAA